MKPSQNSKVVKGTIWSLLDVTSRQSISFILNIILARLLFPSDYGIIGVVLIFTSFADVIADGGLSVALIRKIDRTTDDESTAFYINILIGVFLYISIFALSPFIASFFYIPDLNLIIRITSVSIIFNSCSIVQNSILISDMRLGVITKMGVIIQVSSGIIAVVLAYAGMGVWALVVQIILSSFLRMITLWFITKWMPQLYFCNKSFSYLWSFGSKLLLSNVIGTIYDRIYSFLIGKKVGYVQLGLYTRADSLASQGPSIVNATLAKVLIPYLKSYIEDKKQLQERYMEVVEVASFLIFPIMILLISISKPLFLILFGERWMEAVPIFRIICFGYAWGPFTIISLQLLQTLGDSKYFLKLEIFKKIIQTLIILLAFQFGFWGIIVAQPFYFIIGTFINLSIAHKYLGSSYFTELICILKYMMASLPIMIIGYFVNDLNLHAIYEIILITIAGMLLYLAIILVFKFPALLFVKKVCKSNFK